MTNSEYWELSRQRPELKLPPLSGLFDDVFGMVTKASKRRVIAERTAYLLSRDPLEKATEDDWGSDVPF